MPQADLAALIARWRDGWSVERLRLAYRLTPDEVLDILRPAIRVRERDPAAFDGLRDLTGEGRPVPDGLPHFARHVDHVEAVLLGGGFPAIDERRPGDDPKTVRLVWPPGGGPIVRGQAPRRPPATARAAEGIVLRDLEANILDRLVRAGRPGLAFRMLAPEFPGASSRTLLRTLRSLTHRSLVVNKGAGSTRAVYCATAKAEALVG